MTFDELVSQIPQIGYEHHAQTILENSKRNGPLIRRTIRNVGRVDAPCLLISAGPSLYSAGILRRLARHDRRDRICIVATDGAYIQCLKAGITPDWVITLDPHPTRIVRWFGDPDYSENSKHDDYFQRQDLDVSFRTNALAQNEENIKAVDANPVPLVICTTAPANVVARTSRFSRFWFAPLVDDPAEDGLTREICAITGCPALNTGGTVGTAAWAFAHQVLGSKNIAVVGMDFGYPLERPLNETQEWNMLKDRENVRELYPERVGYWGKCYTSPTYWYYLQNFLGLLDAADARVTNCSEAGLLYGERVDCMNLETWLKSC